MMPDRNRLSDEQFRQEWRDWLAANVPSTLRRPVDRMRGQEMRDWLALTARDGWRAPGWPAAVGGMGIALPKQIIYQEELDRAGVARLLDIGGTLLAPVLLQYGTDAQRTRYLPPILDGTELWCQGYSEPGAGSDLASLRTTARLDGDEYVIDGQKIWTTHANDADAIFVLARTNSAVAKQAGISFFLVDIQTPRITIRPIVNIAGEDEFCEVFFDGVRVPAANIVGAVDQGWTVAKALLGSERINIATPILPRLMIGYIERVARHLGIEAAPGYRAALATLLLDLTDVSALHADVCDFAGAGIEVGPDLSTLKILNADLTQRCAALLLDVAQEHSAEGCIDVGGETVDLAYLYMLARPTSIFGGTSEIQRNILAKTVLRLPAS
jgi:alkylation response protein AidB-like acyl-CoA dehydrogenase